MIIPTYVYAGEAYWYGSSPTEEGEATEDILRIRSLYDAGLPFYTKETLREVDQQLEMALGVGQKILVKALNGATVDFEIESGLTLPAGEPDFEMVLCVHSLLIMVEIGDL